MRLTFIDLETTSADGNLTNVIQLGARRIIDGKIEKEINSFFSNNGQFITLGARTLSGITEQQLLGKPLFEDSEERQYLIQNSGDSIFVAHNGKGFDFKVLSRYDVSFKYTIDTLCVAQIVLDDKFEELEQSYKLGHLRYWMQDRQLISLPNLEAHDAYNDILILEQVFYGLMKIYQQKHPEKTEKDILSDFVLMTNRPQLLSRMPFGKHKGQSFADVPKSYLTWCLANMAELDDNMKFTIDHYLNIDLTPTIQVPTLPPTVNVPPLPQIVVNDSLNVDPSTFIFK